MLTPDQISQQNPIEFPLRLSIDIVSKIPQLSLGKHAIEVKFDVKTYGSLTVKVEGAIREDVEQGITIPRDKDNDYNPEIIAKRQKFFEDFSGVTTNHIKHYSFDPETLKGNIEGFIGVAQVPIGMAAP